MQSLKTIANETYQCWLSGKIRLPTGETVLIDSDVTKCKRETEFFTPKELTKLRKKLSPIEGRQAEITFELITTLDAVLNVLAQDPSARIGALNFASAKKPGGGWLNGAQAQEESLARASTLIASLIAPQCDEFYKKLNHPSIESGIYTDAVIYSPDCLLIRDSQGNLCSPKKCSFITCAAVNAGVVLGKLNIPSKIEEIMQTRVANIFAVAAHQKLDILVLGAWGTGVFQTPVEMIARCFRDQVKIYHSHFKQIIFAIPDQKTMYEFQQIYFSDIGQPAWYTE